MGLPSIPSLSADGEVQGRKAELRYDRSPIAKLFWNFRESDEEHVIEADRIVGLIRTSTYRDDEYSLMFVEISSSAGSTNPAESTTFHHMDIKSPPTDLIKDFFPSGSAAWALKPHDDFAASFRTDLKAGRYLPQVILSTKSGHGDAETLYDNLIKPFLAHNGCPKHDLHRTTSSAFITELCRKMILPAGRSGSAMLIILVSGDGGIVDLVNALLPPTGAQDSGQTGGSIESKFEPQICGLVPAGTGNALAHSSGLTSDRTLGLSSLMRGTPKVLPVFIVRFSHPATVVVPPSDETSPPSSLEKCQRVTEVHGAVVFSWALHAALVADSDTPAYRKLGAERFQIAAKENLFPPHETGSHPYRGALSFQRPGQREWHRVPREAHSYVLATLCSKLEEKFTISPLSKPLDGKLRLVHFGPNSVQPMSGDQIIGLMQKAYDNGKHVLDAAVGYEEIAGLRLELNEDDDGDVDEAHGGPSRWRRICVDGKIFACEPGTVIEVRAPEKGVPNVVRLVSGAEQP